MGWDGAGNYNRVHNFSADASAGIKILASRMDAEINDMASAFTRVWTRDGQNTPTQDIPMGGRKFVNVGAPTSVGNFMRAREFIENVPIFMQDAETSADRVSVSSQYFTSVSANQAPGDGTKIMVRVLSDKSSAVLYLDGHSANIEQQDGNRIGAAMVSGGIYELTYSSVDTAWKLPKPDDGRTDAERSASVTPTNYAYEAEPVIDIRRYGFSESATATVNAVAFQRATAVASAYSTNGAVIQLPPGTFDLGANTVDIPQYVSVRGAGIRATRINNSNSGTYAFRLGGASTGVLKYGCGLTDLRVQMSHVDGKAIQLLETCTSFVKRVYIEGPINATRSTKGVVIDGGDGSAFFNLIEQVQCNHIHIGFEQLTSGTTQPTQNTFLQCDSLGDVATDTSSIGYRIDGGFGGEGSGSIWIGGNLETCFRGMYFVSGCGASSHVGARFEGNTKDVEAEATPGAQSFLGCWLDDVNGIADGSGGTRLKFIGCTNGSNLFGITRDPGTHLMQALVTGQTPLRAIAFPSDTTTDEITVEDSSNTVMFSVTAQGKVRRINGAAPATVTGSRGGNAALADLLTKLSATGIIVDGSSA